MYLIHESDLDAMEQFIIDAKESATDEKLLKANSLLTRISAAKRGYKEKETP